MGFTTGREFRPALRMHTKYNAKYLVTKSEREKYFHLAYNKHTQFLRYQERIMSKAKEKKVGVISGNFIPYTQAI